MPSAEIPSGTGGASDVAPALDGPLAERPARRL